MNSRSFPVRRGADAGQIVVTDNHAKHFTGFSDRSVRGMGTASAQHFDVSMSVLACLELEATPLNLISS
jgi:hypothetical protein